MSDPINFYRTMVGTVGQAIINLQQLQTLADRISQDSSLAGRAATAAQASGRADLTTADFDNAVSAINQLLFTFNSGNPTQKAFLYKLL
jgi:hypothetical protein